MGQDMIEIRHNKIRERFTCVIKDACCFRVCFQQYMHNGNMGLRVVGRLVEIHSFGSLAAEAPCSNSSNTNNGNERKQPIEPSVAAFRGGYNRRLSDVGMVQPSSVLNDGIRVIGESGVHHGPVVSALLVLGADLIAGGAGYNSNGGILFRARVFPIRAGLAGRAGLGAATGTAATGGGAGAAPFGRAAAGASACSSTDTTESWALSWARTTVGQNVIADIIRTGAGNSASTCRWARAWILAGAGV